VHNTDANRRETTRDVFRLAGIDMEACFVEMSSHCIIYHYKVHSRKRFVWIRRRKRSVVTNVYTKLRGNDQRKLAKLSYRGYRSGLCTENSGLRKLDPHRPFTVISIKHIVQLGRSLTMRLFTSWWITN
jgi:hypothetical protein